MRTSSKAKEVFRIMAGARKRYTPKQRMKKRKDRFVVGYISSGHAVYGVNGNPYCLEPLTSDEADATLEDMMQGGCAVFELVPVKYRKR